MNDRDYIPGERRPGFFTVVFVSALTSAAVSVFSVAALMRWGSLGAAFGFDAAAATTATHGATGDVGARIPDVVGMSAEAADELLSGRKLRLVVQERRPHPSLAAGVVIAQTPLAQSRVSPGGEVAVVLSTGPARSQVPDVSNKPIDAAKSALETAGYHVGQVTEADNSTVAPGTVVASAPAAGTALDPGASVALTVARAAISVPKLLGEHIRKAREAIEKAGLAVGDVREVYDEHRRGYLVLTQDPEAGTKVAPGSKINLVVNQGD